MITLQYLENAPDLAMRPLAAVVDKLRLAADILPISHLIIGWHLPRRMLDACREEAARLGVRFLRWQPLLTGDGVFVPHPEWRVVGTMRQQVPGFRGLAEFTFTCPNHPEVRQAVQNHLEKIAGEGLYDGFFLDRMRFPSPSGDPMGQLACFCPYCRNKAAESNLDLEAVRRCLLALGDTHTGRLDLVLGLLGYKPDETGAEPISLLHNFLDFRQQSITEFVAGVTAPLKQRSLEIGLDCFSPGLARMVGQRLDAFDGCADWIKVMSYAHALGPSGLPYEILGFLDYLASFSIMDESELLDRLGTTLDLPLPASRRPLQKDGISTAALQQELQRCVRDSHLPVLAGIELVEIPGVAQLDEKRIRADLEAVKHSGVAGLALSWDLWEMPLERLGIVRDVFLDE